MPRSIRWSASCLLAVALFFSPAGLAAEMEPVSTRSAADLLPAELLKSRHHQVRDEVFNDGFFHRYTIDSDFGEFQALGDTVVRIRIHEIKALAKLQAVSKLDRFGEGIEKAATNPIFAFVNFIEDPADTITGIPKGVGRWFTRLGGMVTGERGNLEEGYAKELVGFSKTKRQVAHRLGVNPYTTNKTLQKELNRTSWVIWAGGVTLSALFAAGNEPYINAYMAAGIPRTLGQLLLDETPEDLQKRNRESLAGMGLSQALIERFLYNPDFSPSHETAITLALEKLEGATGRDAAVDQVASLTEDAEDAMAYQQQFASLVAYHEQVEPVAELFIVRNVIAARSQSGRVAVVLPLDEVFWTAPVQGAAQDLSSRFEKVEIAITGRFSERAEKQLDARGIKLREGLRPKESTE